MSKVPVKEYDIHVAIVELLELLRVFHFAIINELAGGGQGARIRMARSKKMGLRSGVSDLVAFPKGRVVFLEVKTPKGRLSKNQREFRDIVLALGLEYYVVRSVDEAALAVQRGEGRQE